MAFWDRPKHGPLVSCLVETGMRTRWSFYAVGTISPMCASHAKVQLYYICSDIGMGFEHDGSTVMIKSESNGLKLKSVVKIKSEEFFVR